MLDDMGWVFLLGGRKHPNYEYIGDFYIFFVRLLYIPRLFGLGIFLIHIKLLCKSFNEAFFLICFIEIIFVVK